MSTIQDMSSEVLRVEEGSLYPALHRMEEAGWIRAQWITKDTGRRARLYELTVAGNRVIIGQNDPSQRRTGAEHCEIVTRNRLAPQPLALDTSQIWEVLECECIREHVGLSPEVFEFLCREKIARVPLGTPGELIEPVWIAHRERPQH